jgi:hypothetical protein
MAIEHKEPVVPVPVLAHPPELVFGRHASVFCTAYLLMITGPWRPVQKRDSAADMASFMSRYGPSSHIRHVSAETLFVRSCRVHLVWAMANR